MNRSKLFFTAFDNMCCRKFAQIVVKMNDHNKGIIPMECFDTYVDLAEECFPWLWHYLRGLRDMHSNKTAKAKWLIRSKKQQVILQLFALRRMRNPQSLKWWSLIQSVAYYGWGFGQTALNITNYWGMACSSATVDNVDKCVSNLANSPLSLQESSEIA